MNLITLDKSKESDFFGSSFHASIMLRYAALLSWKQTHDLKLDLLHVLYSLTSEQ